MNNNSSLAPQNRSNAVTSRMLFPFLMVASLFFILPLIGFIATAI
jgi:hypothetical protein